MLPARRWQLRDPDVIALNQTERTQIKMKKGALTVVPILFLALILLGCTSGCGANKETMGTGVDVSSTTSTSSSDLQTTPPAAEPTMTATIPHEEVVAAAEAETKEAAVEVAKKKLANKPGPEERVGPPEDMRGGPKGSAAAKAEPTGAQTVGDTSQQFMVGSFPDAIMIDRSTIEQHGVKRDPRLGYLKITGLKVAEDGKTVEFNIENTFSRPNAQAVHLGELMVCGLARVDYDDSDALHNCVLLKEKRLTVKEGANAFRTDPQVYPHVTKVEGVQFFLTPAELSTPVATAGSVADTTEQFSVNNLPDVILIDPTTIEQHSVKRDPRLEYLRITGLEASEDGRKLKFCIENTFDRANAEPIHVPGLMVTGMGRFDYDGGATLRSCILAKERRLTFEKGSKCFETDPETYPHVTKIETCQFFFTP
jgi:hypothetical protein